jgi:hypothetical protein
MARPGFAAFGLATDRPLDGTQAANAWASVQASAGIRGGRGRGWRERGGVVVSGAAGARLRKMVFEMPTTAIADQGAAMHPGGKEGYDKSSDGGEHSGLPANVGASS